MPTYQYLCTECEQPLEVVQGFNDDRLTECPACSGRLRQVFSAVGVVFKGSGFYRTDSRSSTTSGSSPAPATTPSAPATEGAGSSSGSDKAATSTPAAPAAASTPTGGGDKVA